MVLSDSFSDSKGKHHIKENEKQENLSTKFKGEFYQKNKKFFKSIKHVKEMQQFSLRKEQ